ncbi:S1 family peptidase [Actinoplanes sp. NBRC 101535]|uniref:S1 family peptidase n=1 Tax=Actinoplanes sp. NBRC 101535 TaxID=3032196 RepID=UPI00249FDB69|nr:S1 family peptidase [Actinoplanes sp. NBRC 101535]GLY01065.1 hypothetical protein Acsp01_14440 [Actinoplanes sp. NBRC 101535]
MKTTYARRRAAVLTAALIGAGLTPLAGGTAAQALSGTSTTDTALAFAVKITTGDAVRSCTGALLDQWWVVTAKTCFDDGTGVVAGAPKQATTATIGRLDLTTAAGTVAAIDKIVPHPDRNLVLARLRTAALGATTVAPANSAPTEGEILLGAGYGRTADTWVPNQLHTGSFAVSSVDDGTIGVVPRGDAAICKGDAGGPILRSVDGGYQLAGLHHTSTQAGCLTVTGSEKSAVETRVDDIAPWITANTPVPHALQVSVTDTRVGVLRGDYGTQVKEGGLSTSWTQLLSSSRQIEVADDRIGVLTQAGVAYVKEGATTATFVNESGGVQQLAISGNRVGVLSDAGVAYVKEGGLSSSWVNEASGIKQLEVTDTRVGVLSTAGVLQVKEGGLSTGWTTEYSGVKQFSISGDRIGIVTNSGASLVKEGGLSASWVSQTTSGADSIVLRDDRVGVLTGAGAALVKEGALTSAFVTQYTGVREMSVSDSRVGVVTYDGAAMVKHGGLSATWTTVW